MPIKFPINILNNPPTFDFVDLPAAALVASGTVFRCNPLVTGQNYTLAVSDGIFLRPYCNEQKVYILAAPINMAVNNTSQLLLQIPFPPLSFPDGRTYIKTVIGIDKLAITPPATSDTCTITQRFGPLGTVDDPILFNTALATTVISAGATNEANRVSATSIRKHGVGPAGAVNAMSGTGTGARSAAITVGNFDTEINYLSVYGQMTTGTNEYGVLHAFTVEIMG